LCHIHRRLSDGFSDVKYRRNHRRNHRRLYAHPEAHACLTRVVCTNTDGFSDGITDGSRMSDTWSSAQIPTDFPTPNTDGITDGSHMSDTCLSAPIPTALLTDRKVRRDFRTFFVQISINCRRNYRRNLISSTTINFRQKLSYIYRPIPPLCSFSPLLPFSSSLVYI